MKLFFRMAPIFLIGGILVLLYPWSGAEKKAEETERSGEVGVHVERDTLHISYTFHNLEPGIYKAELPEKAGELSCSYEDGRSCWMDQQQLNYEGGDPVIVHYQQPFEEGFVDESWLLKLHKDGEYQEIPFTLTVKDFSKEAFRWTAPVKLESSIAMEHVHYYRFEAAEVPFPLFAADQTQQDVRKVEHNVVIYEKDEPLTYEQKADLHRALEGQNGRVVELDRNHSSTTASLVKRKDREVENLEGEILTAHLQSSAGGISDFHEQVIQDVYRSDPPVTEAGKQIKSGLSTQELRSWKEVLLSENQVENVPVFLDDTLSEITQGTTHFFQRKAANEDVSFFFTLDQDLQLQGARLEERAVRYKQVWYYPLASILKASDFPWSTLEDGKVFRIQTDDNHFRFFVDHDSFIVNEESFGTGEEVVKSLGGIVYMKEEELENLLNFRVVKDEDVIAFQKK
ncbi:hypothetical protein [Halobacillus kuroshimensis]|uniref:hypothetical protein n=1 Tax=Halobacillus kuroshimensis TaxID=302481 RepID=UPI0004107511|nr:hypothetical protein [Halobacillus kuroshimensis]